MHTIEDYMESYIALTKASQIWYHSAHHVSKGPSFLSDHNDLFAKLYKLLDDHYDMLVEKSIVLSGSENFACPVTQSRAVALVLEKCESPINKSADQIISIAMNLIVGDKIK